MNPGWENAVNCKLRTYDMCSHSCFDWIDQQAPGDSALMHDMLCR
jgi:hypothetical protein